MALHYQELGDPSKDTLLILHGLFGSGDNWLSIAKMLQEDYHILLPDQRNHGNSFHSETWNYEAMSSDILELINSLAIDSAYFLGHSMGGKTLMEFACSNSERVKKLLVADIAPKYYPPHHQEILEGLNAVTIETLSGRSEADKQLASHIPIPTVRQFLLKNLERTKQGYSWKINLKVITESIEEVGKGLEDHNIFSGETLFIRGENSDYILKEDKQLIQSHFPNSKIISVKNAGHWLHAEQPTIVADIMRNFFKD